jgi:hypothetical protein
MLFLFDLQETESANKPAGHIVVFTTVAAKATQSRSPVEVMLIVDE